jgi:hypothetical protein
VYGAAGDDRRHLLTSMTILSSRPSSDAAVGLAVRAVCAAAIAAGVFVLAGHAASYFFVFDDFPLIGQASRWPLHDIVAEPLLFFYRPGLFLWMRGAHRLFGWHTPQGYAALAIALHAVNAALVGRLAARLVGTGAAAWTTAAVFFLGPWSAEAVFWVSGGFDLLATCGALSALLAGLAFCVPGRRPIAAFALLLACAAATVLALFTKESTVALAGLFALAALARPASAAPLSRMRIGGVLALMTATTLAYLAIRSVVVASLTGGAYGSWFALMSGADVLGNAASFGRAALVWPAPHDALMHTVGLMAHIGPASSASLLGLTLASAILRPRATLVLAAAIGLCVLPVLWLGLHPGTSSGGRVLYLAGVPFVLLCATGMQALLAQRASWLRWGTVGAASVVMSAAVVSLHAQRVVWAQACHLSRASVDAFRPFVGQVDPVHIDNLPFWFVEGPYVIKSYAFAYYYFPAPVPVASATALTLVSVHGRVTVTTRVPEPGAGPAPAGARPVTLAIDLP